MANVLNTIGQRLARDTISDREQEILQLKDRVALLEAELQEAASGLEAKEKMISEAEALAESRDRLIAGKDRELDELKAQMEAGAKLDPLTGLVLESEFLSAAEAELMAAEPDKKTGVVWLTVRAGWDEKLLKAIARVTESVSGACFTRIGSSFAGVLRENNPERLLNSLNTRLEQLDVFGTGDYGVYMGTAIFPDDGTALQKLMTRARAAAFTAKNVGITHFEEDNREHRLLADGEIAVRQLIDKKQVRFLLRPIVRASNAKVEAYTLSMVPTCPEPETTEEALSLAKFWGLERELEKLLWFEGMKFVTALVRSGRLRFDTKIRIASLPGAYLSKADLREFEEIYLDELKQLIVEISDTENTVKVQRAKGWRALTAAGCNGLGDEEEQKLCRLSPKLVCARGMVAGIGKSKRKQAAFTELRAYADRKGMEIIAEGMESAADLKTVIRLGADFLEGDFLGKADSSPAELSEKRIEQIGEALYGKRG